MASKYKFPTKQYIPGGHDDERLDMSFPNVRQIIRIEGTYTYVPNGNAVLYDGHPAGILRNLAYGVDGNRPISVRGIDYEWIQRYLYKNNGIITPITDQDGSFKQLMEVPVALNPGDLPTPQVIYDYNAFGQIATTLATLTATIKTLGIYESKGVHVKRLKAQTNTNGSDLNNVQDFRVPLQATGRAKAYIFIVRNHDTPFARANNLLNVDLGIEGYEKINIDWEEMQYNYMKKADQGAILDGIGLIEPEDLPIVNGNSFVYLTVGPVDTDITMIEIVEPIGTSRPRDTPTPQISPDYQTGLRSVPIPYDYTYFPKPVSTLGERMRARAIQKAQAKQQRTIRRLLI